MQRELNVVVRSHQPYMTCLRLNCTHVTSAGRLSRAAIRLPMFPSLACHTPTLKPVRNCSTVYPAEYTLPCILAGTAFLFLLDHSSPSVVVSTSIEQYLRCSPIRYFVGRFRHNRRTLCIENTNIDDTGELPIDDYDRHLLAVHPRGRTTSG